MRKLIIFGGGGHCNSCIDVILTQKKFKIASIIDEKLKEKKNLKLKFKTIIILKKIFQNLTSILLVLDLLKTPNKD